jgi:subtilisin family serine protease
MSESESKSHRSRNKGKAHPESAAEEEPSQPTPEPTVAESTTQPNTSFQRFLVLLRPNKFGDDSELKAVREKAKALIGDLPFNILEDTHSDSSNWLPDGQACYLPNLHVLVLSLTPDQFGLVQKFAEKTEITQLVVPERTMKVHVSLESLSAGSSPSSASPQLVEYVCGYRDAVLRLLDSLTPAGIGAEEAGKAGALSEYLRGYRNGTLNISAQLQSGPGTGVPGAKEISPPARWMPRRKLPAEFSERLRDTAEYTWGLLATGVVIPGQTRQAYTGNKVRVALLDTGCPKDHPDFKERIRPDHCFSFVAGEDVEDRYGHGTHVLGIVAGPPKPSRGPRYGAAPEAELWIGKVLSNSGSGREGDILAGIEWAIGKECRIVALPFGMTSGNSKALDFYEEIGNRSLQQNTLLIAAAGNRSQRGLANIQPVSVPAGCQSVLGVGAIDASIQMATFSNAGGGDLGGVDLVAPGVDIWSAWCPKLYYRRISGTSAAVGFVAGIGALIAQANPDYKAAEIMAHMLRSAKALPHSAKEAGRGLVQAPAPPQLSQA